jgi:alginate O-acetyltransferase complex protein AlgI
MLAQTISTPLVGLNAWLSIIIFAVQLYLDFYAYSNFAIASAIICGINLPTSFSAPYSSKSLTEFWRRWNITVSQWLKDYVYIGLGGNRKSAFRMRLNIILTFFVSGLWHGASLPFVIWGLVHGTLVIVEKSLLARININKIISNCYQVFVLVSVFLLWQLFRFPTMSELTQFGNVLIKSASLENGIVVSTLGAIFIVPMIDNRKLRHLVFDIPVSTKGIFYEVSVICLLLVLTILFMRPPSLNFFYFKF